MKKENQMNGMVIVCIAVTFVALAIGMLGVFWGANTLNNDYSKLKTSNAELVGDLNIQKEEYSKSIETISDLGKRVAVLEKTNPNVSVNLAWPEKPLEVDVVNQRPDTLHILKPKPPSIPKPKLKPRRPSVNQ